MSHRASTLLLLVALFAAQMFGQGLDTTAAKDDWEEINFEFNSPVLVDGYPSLLRLAELLKNNPNYRVRVEGHADYIGSNRYNDRLATRRADTVKSFLVKYGATDGQITTASQGERAPKVNSRNRDGRFMNRRVIFTVTDAQGNAIRDMAGTPVQMATINDVIRKLDELSGKQDATRDAILRRLDRLDDIAGLLEKLAGQNQQLQDRVRALEQQNTQIRETVQTLPNRQETATIVDTRLEANRDRRYGQINISGGVDDNRNLTLMGRGRFFAPFKDRVAIQAQGEYNYFRSQREGQGDVGVVARAGNFQAGMFGSLKYVSLRTTQSGVSQLVPTQRLLDAAGSSSGYLGQFSFLGDFILPRGKVGIFATRKFRDGAVIGRTPLVSALTFPGATGATSVTSSNVYTETFLGVMNQFGGSATIGLAGDSYIEANFAGLRSEYLRNYRAGGGARLVLPLSPLFAFTIEGDLNPTLVSATNTTRIMAGLQFGNFIRPKEFGTLTTPVPMDIPRVRYEVLTRTVRNGNGTPTADAGGDQSGIAAGPVTLNGSRSFDPDGDALTYQWEQIAGPSVPLSGANTSTATFTAAQGQVYSFRLTVTDTQGARGIDRATITTQAAARVVRIVSFAASPASITAGQASTLNYSVENAESVTIEGIGTVNATSGSSQVTPQQTTTYRLVARGGGSEVVATTVVTVTQVVTTARFLACSIAPGTITAGQSATITYATENATQVSISGIGNVEPSGSRTVTPTQTTNYTLTATGQSGAAATCSLAVTVSPAPVAAPRIVSFVANPATVTAGAGSILQYAVEGATTVTISGVSQQLQPNTGSVPVTPAQTTTYTLTAINQTGQVTSTATVTVNAVTPTAPTLTACSANPATSAAAGNPVVLNFTAANATAVSVDNGVGTVPVGGGVTVRPQATTTYTVTATGANNQTASCQIVVTVTVGPGPTAVIAQGDSIETISRQIMLDASPSTNPGGGQLTYQWEPLGVGAAVLDQGQPMTRIQIGGLFGDYQIRLTVRNAAGQSSTALITVRFRSTSVF